MESVATAMFGAVGSVALFGFLAFAIWMDYRKKKDERDAAHQERMKALEMGYPPQDAEIARAKAYAGAAWAAGLIGLVVPVVVTALAVAATIVAVLHRAPDENLVPGLSIAWSIAAVIVLVAILRSLSVIRQLPRPNSEAQPRGPARDRRPDSSSAEYQEKRLEL
jgi:hypothetical protein